MRRAAVVCGLRGELAPAEGHGLRYLQAFFMKALFMAIGQFAYANNSNRFLAAPALDNHAFAIAGVPFDGAVTNRPGARFAPQEIRRASLMLCDGIHPVFNVSPLGVLGDAADMLLPNASPLAEVRKVIEQQAAVLMAAHHCVFLGGDHSVTLPLLRAAKAADVEDLVQRCAADRAG